MGFLAVSYSDRESGDSDPKMNLIVTAKLEKNTQPTVHVRTKNTLHGKGYY